MDSERPHVVWLESRWGAIGNIFMARALSTPVQFSNVEPTTNAADLYDHTVQVSQAADGRNSK